MRLRRQFGKQAMVKANAECVLPASAAFEQSIVKARTSSEAMTIHREGEAGYKDQVHAREIGSRTLLEFRRREAPIGVSEQLEIIHVDQLNRATVRARKAKCRRVTVARPKRPDIRLAFHRNKSADEPRFRPLAGLLNGAANRFRCSTSLSILERERAAATESRAQIILRRDAVRFHTLINMRKPRRSKSVLANWC